MITGLGLKIAASTSSTWAGRADFYVDAFGLFQLGI